MGHAGPLSIVRRHARLHGTFNHGIGSGPPSPQHGRQNSSLPRPLTRVPGVAPRPSSDTRAAHARPGLRVASVIHRDPEPKPPGLLARRLMDVVAPRRLEEGRAGVWGGGGDVIGAESTEARERASSAPARLAADVRRSRRPDAPTKGRRRPGPGGRRACHASSLRGAELVGAGSQARRRRRDVRPWRAASRGPSRRGRSGAEGRRLRLPSRSPAAAAARGAPSPRPGPLLRALVPATPAPASALGQGRLTFAARSAHDSPLPPQSRR